MISCVSWVPKGAANPKPKRYEMSAAELELLKEYSGKDAAAALEEQEEGNDNDEEEEEMDDEEEKAKEEKKIVLPKIDPSTLPPELRMEEYSDDDDDDDDDEDDGGNKIGNMLIGKDSEMMGTHIGEDGMPVEDVDDDDDDDNDNNNENDDGDNSNDEDSDDDLADVPDTREYAPVDVEGLQSMGFGRNAIDVLNGNMDEMEGDEIDEDDDSDVEDTNLTPDDALILVAKTEEDFPSLEVHVYEQTTGNLYVHHDIPLPSFPLCLAHGDINNTGGAGNYCAIGTFDPGIEIWNLDVLDVLEPTCVLGGKDTSDMDELMKANMTGSGNKKKRKKKKKKKGNNGLQMGSHTDAVMGLSWNKIHRQVLASASADTTVKVWDITRATSPGQAVTSSLSPLAATYQHHTDKVQSVAWHPTEGTILASGSYDRSVCLIDARMAGGGGDTTNGGEEKNSSNVRRAKIPADCEAIAWDTHKVQYLTAASEDGTVMSWDVRKFGDGPVWSFVAHEFGGVSDLSYNTHVPGMLATCAIDKTVALWDTHHGPPTEVVEITPGHAPYPCGSKDMGVGKLISVSFYPSAPWLLGCGGSGNQLSLWDLSSEATIQKRFGDRVIGQVENVGTHTNKEEGRDKAGEVQREDFEAIIAAGDAAAKKAREGGKKKKKGKKKVHRKGQ